MSRHWWSIEVRHGAFSASLWRDMHSAALIEAAITNRAREWAWVEQPWGVILEIAFREPSDWARFRDLPAVQAALDAVPDRLTGLYVYPGRGGSSGSGARRPTRVPLGTGAAAVPIPQEPVIVSGHPDVEGRPPALTEPISAAA
jgi:hypothetical protein